MRKDKVSIELKLIYLGLIFNLGCVTQGSNWSSVISQVQESPLQMIATFYQLESTFGDFHSF